MFQGNKLNKLLVLFIFWLMTGCTPVYLPSASSTSSISTSTVQSRSDQFIFTYSTFDGQIFRVKEGGQKQQIIPTDEVQKEYLSWSPDRTHLAYVAAEATEKGLLRTLWVVNSDGNDVRPVFGPVKVLRYSWDEDGRTIYVEEAISFDRIPFDEDTVIRVYLINSETGNVQEFERRTTLFPPPVEAPDRKKAIWTDPTDNKWTLYLLDNEKNKISIIYQPPSDRIISGVWSPNSQELAILKPEDQEIYLYNVDTGDWNRISFFSAAHQNYLVGNIQWSPNERWLSYALNDQEQANQLCVLSVEEEKEQCFNTQLISNQYVWSLDSQYIGFLSKTSSGKVDLFMIDINEAEIGNLTNDGNELIEQNLTQ